MKTFLEIYQFVWQLPDIQNGSKRENLTVSLNRSMARPCPDKDHSRT